MKFWRKALLAVLLALALFLAWHVVRSTQAERDALAVIGGADGPTSILIGTSVP